MVPAPTGPVLVLTNRDDLTADMVIHDLTQRSVPVVRLDPADFPRDCTLAARLDDSLWRGAIGSVEGRSFRLEEVRAVYYRRPGLPTLADAMTDAAQEWSLREAIHGLYGVLGSLDCLYVNHPALNYAAEFKPRQLAVAARCGLETPATLVTNDPDEARAFAKEAKAIIKPIRGGMLIEDGQHKAAYTALVDAADIDDSLHLTAHLLQAWVPKKHEVRLVVVGHQLVAAEIHAESDAARVDFRADYDAITAQPRCRHACVRACDPSWTASAWSSARLTLPSTRMGGGSSSATSTPTVSGVGSRHTCRNCTSRQLSLTYCREDARDRRAYCPCCRRLHGAAAPEPAGRRVAGRRRPALPGMGGSGRTRAPTLVPAAVL